MKNGIADQIEKIVKVYSESLKKDLKKDFEEIIEKGLKKLEKDSPKDKGNYASGWVRDKKQDIITIHQKNEPGLTHLKENGYVHVGGVKVKPVEHIEPVREWIEDEAYKAIDKRLK